MNRMKMPAVAALLLVLTACIGAKRNMEVTYTMRSGASLKEYTAYLVINDQRKNQDLVGQEARERGLFEELRGGRFDLKIDMPNGSQVTMTNLTPVEAVREAVSRKLGGQGVNTTSQRSSAHLTVEVNIDQMEINVEGSDLVSHVFLSTKIYRDSSAVSKSNSGATSNRIKLIGGAGGATVLSQSLSQALNELDFSGLNRF